MKFEIFLNDDLTFEGELRIVLGPVEFCIFPSSEYFGDAGFIVSFYGESLHSFGFDGKFFIY